MDFTRRFINHNKKIFKIKNLNRKKIFLIEFNGWQAIHIIFSYVVNYFKKEKNCKIIAYECYDFLNRIDPPWYNKYIWKLGILFNVRTFKIFKSFGTDEFLKPTYTVKQDIQAEKIVKLFYKNKPNLTKLENFRINKIWIGDLIYDSYLKKNYSESIDIYSVKFKIFFKNSIKLYLFWKRYFDKNLISGITVCHSVYLTGIPLRIAQSKKIDCLSIDSFNMDLVNLVNDISYKDRVNGTSTHYLYFRKIFSKFSKKNKAIYIKTGKKILEDYTSGKKRLFYLKNKTFSSIKNYNLKKRSAKTKVVIFAHDFVDSPHVYGNHFFPDFKLWFDFLDNIIKKTNYDWYLKYHPGANEVTTKEILKLKKKNKKLIILKKNFPNNKLKTLGIKFGLTVFGTIASELPGYGIRVINASRNNPHFDYNFSITPKNIYEYEKLLLNLHKIKDKFIFKKNDLYIFHFVKELIFQNHLIFKDTKRYFEFKNKIPLRFTPKIYHYWLQDFDQKLHEDITKNMKRFIESKRYLTLNQNIDTFYK